MLDKFFDFIQSGEFGLALAIAVLSLIANIERIMSIIYFYNRKRLSLLKEAVAEDSVSPNLKSNFIEDLQGEYFYLAHKVRVERFKRDLILKTYEENKGAIELKDLLLSHNQLVVKDESLKVEISRLDHVVFFYNLIVGFVVALFGFSLLIAPIDFDGDGAGRVISWLVLCLFYLGLGFFMFYQTFPVIAAKRIRRILNQT